MAQAAKPQTDFLPIATVKKLYGEGRWEEIVRLVPVSSDQPAEFDLYRGLALARLQRWAEAKAAFETGRKKAPRDKRFLVELAGVAYQQRNFGEAKAGLKRALRVDPTDPYARNFLATLYLAEGNLEAALHSWNRISEPKITDVTMDPQPHVRAVLLDRVFAFSLLSTLKLEDLRTTEARLDNLEIFSRYRFDLVPDAQESFAVRFHSIERNGWGESKLLGLLALLRGLPFQTIYPEFYNLNESAMNLLSLARWDAEKRRLFLSFSTPLRENPKWRFQVYLDGRQENWNLSDTFRGSSVPLFDLGLQKAEAGAEIRSVESGRWSWGSGVSVAHRTFLRLDGISPPASAFFTDGFSLEYRAHLDAQLLNVPERRLRLDSAVSGSFGRIFADPLGSFGKSEGFLAVRWFPLSRGDDYEMNTRFRAGRTYGRVPLDEFFILGVERDNNLWLRGHIGTRDGKKGSAPMGREYALWNWEADKIAYQGGFFELKIGPFLDAGWITDPSGDFGSDGWLWDPGVQCKLRVLGSFSVVFSYGRDLRSGRNAFYTTVSR